MGGGSGWAIRDESPRPSGRPATIAEDFGERLAAEGEICWGGMHSWRRMVNCWRWWTTRRRSASRPTWRTRMLFTHGLQRARGPLAAGRLRLVEAGRVARLRTDRWRRALRPWTIDFHVAQNDGTVKGSGSHDKTGHHCLPTDPNGKLDIVRDAGAVDAG